MTTAPTFVERETQAYAAVRRKMVRARIAEAAPHELAEVASFLAAHEVAVAGPPIIRYLVVDYGDGEVEIDIGIPCTSLAIPKHDRIMLAVLPAGRWATTMHAGPYDELVHTTAALLDSAAQAGIEWAVEDDQGVTRWAGRVEHYLVGPPAEHDPAKLRTEIAILVRDDRMGMPPG